MLDGASEWSCKQAGFVQPKPSKQWSVVISLKIKIENNWSAFYGGVQNIGNYHTSPVSNNNEKYKYIFMFEKHLSVQQV